MKRLVFLSAVCVTILLITVGVAALLTSRSVQASSSSSTQKLQMFSGTFVSQTLPANSTKVTLISIPFSVSTPVSKLEATSLIDAESGSNGILTCELDLDGVAFFSATEIFDVIGSPLFAGTTGIVTSIAAGNHTFVVACTNLGSTNIYLNSLGTSVIVKS